MNCLQKSNWSDLALICERWVSWVSCRIRCLDDLPKRCPSLTSMTSLLESPQQCAVPLEKMCGQEEIWHCHDFPKTLQCCQHHIIHNSFEMILIMVWYSEQFTHLAFASSSSVQLKTKTGFSATESDTDNYEWAKYISTLGASRTLRNNCTASLWPLIKLSQTLHKTLSKIAHILQELWNLPKSLIKIEQSPPGTVRAANADKVQEQTAGNRPGAQQPTLVPPG